MKGLTNSLNETKLLIWASNTFATKEELGDISAILDSIINPDIPEEEVPEEPTLYSFTILLPTKDTPTYNFEPGMTWGEWMASSYNTYGYGEAKYSGHVDFGNYCLHTANSTSSSLCYVSDTIINNHKYYLLGYTCFIEGTLVLISLDGNTKAIESLLSGDTVISYNFNTKLNYEALVTNVIENLYGHHIVEIICDDGTTLTMNRSHPIYTSEGWKSITNHNGYPTLKIGDTIKTINDWANITSIKYLETDFIPVYTLSIKDFDEEIDNDINDNYYVNGVLVHNKASK